MSISEERVYPNQTHLIQQIDAVVYFPGVGRQSVDEDDFNQGSQNWKHELKEAIWEENETVYHHKTADQEPSVVVSHEEAFLEVELVEVFAPLDWSSRLRIGELAFVSTKHSEKSESEEWVENQKGWRKEEGNLLTQGAQKILR